MILPSVSSLVRVTLTSDGEQACGTGVSQVLEGPPDRHGQKWPGRVRSVASPHGGRASGGLQSARWPGGAGQRGRAEQSECYGTGARGSTYCGGASEDSKVGTIKSRRRALEARGCFLRAIFRPREEKGRRRDRQMV